MCREKVDFIEHDFDVFTLLFELRTTTFQFDGKFVQLAAFVVGEVIQLEQFTQLAEGKPQALAAQGQFEADAVAVAVDAVDAFASRRDQPLIFVMTQGSGGDTEFPGELADVVGFAGYYKNSRTLKSIEDALKAEQAEKDKLAFQSAVKNYKALTSIGVITSSSEIEKYRLDDNCKQCALTKNETKSKTTDEYFKFVSSLKY